MTNELLIVPDGKTSEGAEKSSPKDLYEMFQRTKSHGFVSLQLLIAVEIFFGGMLYYQKMPCLNSTAIFHINR